MTAATPKREYPPATLDVALVALSWISPNTTRLPWAQMGMALKSEFGEAAKDGFIDWSARGEDYNALDTVSAWKSFKGSKVGIGSLIARALAEGFKFEKSTTPVSPEKIAADKAARTARNAKTEANRIRGHAAAAVRAASQLRMASATGESPYLVRKLVEAESCSYTADGGLILPIMDYAPDVALLRGKQAIDADGNKKYSSGMNMQGGSTRLGAPAILDGIDIGLVEGFATGLSVRMAIDWQFPVFVGFDAGNLLHVARMLRAKYPSSRIVIFADDDYLTKHAGQLAAQEAADAVGNALVVLPVITAPRRATKTDESLPKLTDFNDLHCAEGLDVVNEQILAALAAPMVIKPAAPSASPRDEGAHAQAGQSVEDISSAVPGQGGSTPPPADAEPLNLPGDDEAPPNWQEGLIHKHNSTRLEDCRENVYLILINDDKLAGVVGLDEFAMMQVKRRAPPWEHTAGEWTEDDDFSLGMFLAQRYSLVIKSNGALENAVAQAARTNKFNPVTDYLDGCVWDHTERLGTWLHHVAGVVQSPYYDLVGRLMIMSMVARAYHPGCQMDYAPVFEGGQGAGKSSLLRVLGGQWYKETPFTVGDKDGYLAIQGAWLYEIAELDSFNRGDITAIKAFITNTVDDFRAPYGRRNTKYPRRTCFAATTNQDEYLKDTTGARRFWPVRCGTINLDLLAARRDQLFAEAVILIKAGLKWHPTKEEERDLIKPEQEEREIDDVWYPRIYRFVDGIAESTSSQTIPYLTEVTMEVLLTKALQIEIGKLSAARSESTRVGNCMARMGWQKKRRGGGAREWYYLRPSAAEVPAMGPLVDGVAP
jgi:predicted P-loop ATPase/phage/plasmid primase-like uncharacterized protein